MEGCAWYMGIWPLALQWGLGNSLEAYAGIVASPPAGIGSD
jgi:hypothetical protein